MDSALPANASFFIAKAVNMSSLKNCRGTSVWACRDRKLPPQPSELLSESLNEGPIILIYSVTNCHGWHGYAQMLSKPGTVQLVRPYQTANSYRHSHSHTGTELNSGENIRPPEPGNALNENRPSLSYDSGDNFDAEEEPRVNNEDEWMRFRIQWIKCYLDENGERCLPSERTASLLLPDGTPLNKARNFQKLDASTGIKICALMNEHLAELKDGRRKKAEELEAMRPPAFFTADEKREDPHTIWKRLTGKVEQMGTVLLACAFGSQRYNLHNAQSDTDMFIVYAADTRDLLGFSPPQPTIKNRDIDACDYTIHEVHRYLELVLGGDPRCVECFFLHPSSVYYSHPAWRELLTHRQKLLTRECCEKYQRDAEGGKGLRLMEKWVKSGEASQSPMPEKVAKLFYIIIRLLQNASEVASGQSLRVYREEGSSERVLLLRVRAGECGYEDLMAEIKRLQSTIKSNQSAVLQKSSDVKDVIESWLLKLRYDNFTGFFSSQLSEASGTS